MRLAPLPRFHLMTFAMILLTATVSTAEQATAPWVPDFAAEVVAAWNSGTPMPQLSAVQPEATLQDGYAVQDAFVGAVIGKRGIGAYKAAIVAEAGRKNMGLDAPLVAVIPAAGILRAEDGVTMDLAEDETRHVETEIGYRFGEAVRETVPDIAALKLKIKAIMPIIELPGGPVSDEKPATAADLAAWNINAKQIVLGSEEAPDAVDPDSVAIGLTLEGESINTARGGDAMGGQWSTLLETVNVLIGRGYTIEPGQIISNGALGKIVRAAPGRYEGDFGPLGTISFAVIDSRENAARPDGGLAGD